MDSVSFVLPLPPKIINNLVLLLKDRAQTVRLLNNYM